MDVFSFIGRFIVGTLSVVLITFIFSLSESDENTRDGLRWMAACMMFGVAFAFKLFGEW